MTHGIPHNWTSKTLRQIAQIGTGGTPSRSKPDTYYYNGTIPWIKTTDLNNGLITDTEESITNKGLDESSCKILPLNTILIAMYGGFRQIGRTGLTQIKAATNQAISSLIIDSHKAIPLYVLYWLNHNVGYWKKFAASSRKDPNISKKEVASFPIILPPLSEQKKIAEILGVWDRAIENTEGLIAAKRQLKKGLMQQLLTGKRRFKENERDAWITVRLGDVFRERQEPGNEHLPLLSITGLNGVTSRDSLDRRDISSEDKSNYLRICPGDIGYNTMRMWQGVNGVSELEGIVSPAYTICIPDRGRVDPNFMGYLFKSHPVVFLFYRHSQGLVSDTWNLKFHHFAEIKVTIPSIAEQIEIATFLKTHDREIELKEHQLEALKQQKIGLMQKLLTGKIRVRI